jgi:iron complex outermembrane recepter protein
VKSTRSPQFHTLVCCIGLFLCLVAASGQQTKPVEGVADLSIEEILNVPVTSVGRKAQRVATAPAAVYVITQEDIRRSGAQTIPDLLRIVPGLTVARINAYSWAISARGGLGQYANKMQVMIDGRSVYNRLFSGVYWDTQDLLLEDIDRIEVIRGTGAVSWGSNAVNGVIHIITRSAKATQGSIVVAGTGSKERLFGAYRYGGQIGEKLFYRVWGKHYSRDFYSPNASLLRQSNVTESGDRSVTSDSTNYSQDGSTSRFGFRMDWQPTRRDQIQAQGMIYDSDLNVLTWTFNRQFVATQRRDGENAPGGSFQFGWTRAHDNGGETTLQWFGDRSTRESGTQRLRLDMSDFQIQHRRPLGENHELSIAAGARLTTDSLVDGDRYQLFEGWGSLSVV